MFIYPFYALFFQDTGLSLTQITYLFIIWYAAAIITAIPSGILADKISRKVVVILGQLVKLVGFSVWLVSPTFWGFALGLALWGIGISTKYGALEALVYDELSSLKRSKEFVKINGRVESIASSAVFIAAIIAASLIEHGYEFVHVLSIVSAVVALGGILYLPNVRPRNTVSKNYIQASKDAITAVTSNKKVLLLAVIAVTTIAIFQTFDEYSSLIFSEIGLELSQISIAEAFVGLAAVVGSAQAHRLSKYSMRTHVIVTLVSGAIALTGLMLGVISAVVGIVIYTTLIIAVAVSSESQLQEHFDQDKRAAMLSVVGICMDLLGVASFLVLSTVL